MQTQITEIKADLKAMGYTSRMVGVTKRNTPQFECIALTVKTSDVTPDQAATFAQKYMKQYGFGVIVFN